MVGERVRQAMWTPIGLLSVFSYTLFSYTSIRYNSEVLPFTERSMYEVYFQLYIYFKAILV